ncbi:MAG: cobalt-precorrin-5B (C(1))-methyltransferase [Proteobacteria bacterium]|nr:cobalt-precorrin-5B (C(1))-methyltransferase [Pseudomonadota bacterium]
MPDNDRHLRRGWTTGACATAATKAAATALLTGAFPDPVRITLPRGEQPAFALATTSRDGDRATAGIVKDAGDDPDVTHGALVLSSVRLLPPGSGIRFRAGEGVGTVTRPGLPVPPGEPAINPVPRRLMTGVLVDLGLADAEVEIAIPGGEALAQRTLNGRLGIVGGLSILGTTGVVIPYSCAAWIDTIHRGIDVARATGLQHIVGSTGDTSERAAQALHHLPETALIEMGDFVGGMLKYLRRHPVPRVTIAGGVAKMTKLAQGMLDLHSKRGSADLDALAEVAREAGAGADLAERIRAAGSVAQAFAEAGDFPLGNAVAAGAWRTAAAELDQTGITLEVLLFDRAGTLAGRADFTQVGHAPSAPRNRRR